MPIEDQSPVTLLSGGLGAGKTTLLNRLLTVGGEEYGIAVLVNDVGEVNVDANLIENGSELSMKDGGVTELSNGCICCGLQDELGQELRRLAFDEEFDHLVIEASVSATPSPSPSGSSRLHVHQHCTISIRPSRWSTPHSFIRRSSMAVHSTQQTTAPDRCRASSPSKSSSATSSSSTTATSSPRQSAKRSNALSEHSIPGSRVFKRPRAPSTRIECSELVGSIKTRQAVPPGGNRHSRPTTETAQTPIQTDTTRARRRRARVTVDKLDANHASSGPRPYEYVTYPRVTVGFRAVSAVSASTIDDD